MARALVLTSTAQRHRYVARQLSARLDVVGLWQEAKSFEPLRYAGNDDEQRTIAAHFAARDASEAEYFAMPEWNAGLGTRWRQVPAGAINDPAELVEMAACAPEVVVVFGTGLLRQGLLEAFGGRIINMHLGLSPYYRGSGTNFWPLVNREPEYVGATIHLLDSGIDAGPIAAHVRPVMAQHDGPHDVGNKAILEACGVLAEAAEALARGGLRGVPQDGRGRLYQRKDFNAAAVRRLHENFAGGMIAEYLSDKAARDAKLELVSPVFAR